MKRIVRKMDMSISNIAYQIKENIRLKRESFYVHNREKRYAAPINIIFDAGKDNIVLDRDKTELKILRSLTEVLDTELAIVILRDSKDFLMAYTCKMFNRASSASREAKNNSYRHVIDLHTGKIFKTDG